MQTETAWNNYDEEATAKLSAVAEAYRNFISVNKTERESASACIEAAIAAGYISLEEALSSKEPLCAGAKIFAVAQGKAVVLVHVGSASLEEGFRILGAHLDSPRLDVKQNPLYESNGLAFLDTHYYGGIKKYQWVCIPLALHGVVAKKDGSIVDVVIGEEEDDPVFCITDLLPHLGSAQMQKKGSEVVEGEALNVLVGNRPLILEGRTHDAQSENTHASDRNASQSSTQDKDQVKAFCLQLLKDRFGMDEDDFLSAELEVVPAGPARDMGFDRSMILGYGQDDRVCAYTSLCAQLALANEIPQKTCITILVDKEEIGSVGASSMASMFFENTLAEIMELAGYSANLSLRRALAASAMLSSDVSAGFDPEYASVFETKNSAYLGHGLVFNKYTGSRGKSGSNDARAEFVAHIRAVMEEAGVQFQTCELGKVDAGGGGTIAYIPAAYGMDVIDSGVAVLSMHSPWEVTSKADIYEAVRGYEAFLRAY